MTARRAWAATAATVALVLLADQVTKALVRSSVERGEEDPIFPALKLVNVRNEGVAFGFDAGGKSFVLGIVVVALLCLVVYFARHARRRLMWLPTGLLLGGALGNIADRIYDGAVTDFLKLPAWPAFNLADVAITFGVLSLLYVLERDPRAAEDHA